MLQRYAGESRVASVRPADDTDSPSVNNPLRRQRGNAIGDIGLHLSSPLSESGVPKLSAIAGRTAKVRLQHSISARCEGLCPPIEINAIPRFRSSMWNDDER